MGLVIRNVKPICLGDVSDRSEFAISDDGSIADHGFPDFETFDGGGLYLSPGWADLHVHVWFGGTDISVRPERAGLCSGVTVLADAGSAGSATLHGLREHIIERRPESIRAFVNISSMGLAASNQVPEFLDWRLVDVERTLAAIEANREIVCGVKVRASGQVVGTWGIDPLRIAKQVAVMAGLPLMVHIGEPPPLLEEIFTLLTRGDVVTHCFNGKRGGSIVDSENVFNKARGLAEAGIHLDVGHGAASYDFDVAARAISHGLLPYSISTDLHARNVDGPVHDLATTVSKLHAAGLGLEDCVRAITVNPRAFLGLGGSNGLVPGQRADFTLFDIVERELQVEDGRGKRLVLRKLFEPRFTVLGTNLRCVPGSGAGMSFREGSVRHAMRDPFPGEDLDDIRLTARDSSIRGQVSIREFDEERQLHPAPGKGSTETGIHTLCTRGGIPLCSLNPLVSKEQ